MRYPSFPGTSFPDRMHHALRRVHERLGHLANTHLTVGVAAPAPNVVRVVEHAAVGTTRRNCQHRRQVEPAATFTEVYAIISDRCVGCHTSAHPTGLDMSTQNDAYDNLVGIAAAGAACAREGDRVVAGDPDPSVLHSKISEAVPVCGVRMPAAGGPLNAEQIETFRSWIAAGAMDN